jgi:hypothetical protein
MDISRIIAQLKLNRDDDRRRIKHQGEHTWDYGMRKYIKKLEKENEQWGGLGVIA